MAKIEQDAGQPKQSKSDEKTNGHRENPYAEKEAQYEKQYRKQIIDNLELVQQKKKQLESWSRFNQVTAHQAAQKKLHRMGRQAEKSKFSSHELEVVGKKVLRLVPIRIDAEYNGIKVRDSFTWNANGRRRPWLTGLDDLISHDEFARNLCRDVGIMDPPLSLLTQISRSLKDQIEDFSINAPELLDTNEGNARGNDGVDDGEKDLPELRTTIKLDITIDQQCINDQFEWDISCKRNNPEQFADVLVNELGLVPEFNIREQIQTVSKSLLIINHDFRSDIVHDEQLSSLFLPPVGTVPLYRTGKAYDDFGPVVSQASAVEIEKMEKDLERENRSAALVLTR
ncbi:SWI SNF, matrix associated, actin dependent regulator of chromatin, sub b, member 1 [Kappamyces sp. JEL0680]|nr:SWI SNF, matrix associated, actin dependent regulator of chromatin, sub b, member 1 [Kappamyces sp. JEL0680]